MIQFYCIHSVQLYICFQDIDYEPVDNYVNSALGINSELSEEFKKNYELWLQQEVFTANINWDFLLHN